MKRILKRNVFNKKKLSTWAVLVKRRDGFKCKACGYSGYLHSHHILPKSKFPKYAYSVWNGVTLCKLCHLGKNGVHKSGKPRNDLVSKLKVLLKKGCIDSVKKLTNKFCKPVSGNKLKRKSFKRYKPYSSFKKRK